MHPVRSRQVWQRLEAVHAVTYFSSESREANKAAGLRGFWMGYFAARAAPMGAVAAGVVEATFANFHPDMVRRAIPDAWGYASPTDLLVLRARAAADAIGRLAPNAAAGDDVLGLLHPAIGQADAVGRPLFAANREVVIDDDPLGALWQCATTLREHRGDGHVAVLCEAGLDGCETHVLFAAAREVPAELLRASRGWSEDDWNAAEERLATRGLLDGAGQLTPDGRRLHDRSRAGPTSSPCEPYEWLGDHGMDDLVHLLDAFASPILASDEIPFPNPIGLPREQRPT